MVFQIIMWFLCKQKSKRNDKEVLKWLQILVVSSTGLWSTEVVWHWRRSQLWVSVRLATLHHWGLTAPHPQPFPYLGLVTLLLHSSKKSACTPIFICQLGFQLTDPFLQVLHAWRSSIGSIRHYRCCPDQGWDAATRMRIFTPFTFQLVSCAMS